MIIKIKRVLSLLLAVFLILPVLPIAQAKNNWNMEYFYKTYSDSHFNLSNEPNRVMTIEEFIAIIHAYSYYGSGATPITVKDKNGKAPSEWCAKYVQAEANKKVFDPERISWSDPVTLAFAAQFMARAKGKYSYDANNIYSFSKTQNLSADDILYLSVAVDYGLINYKAGMDVSVRIKRRDARDYEIPKELPTPKATAKGNGNTMRECNAYFIDCYWDLDAANQQLAVLKKRNQHITMVTFQSSYLNGENISEGNKFLGCDVEHESAVLHNEDYDRDPQLDAIEYCKESGIMALLGVSNAHNNGFTVASTVDLLSSYSNMSTAVQEIIAAVDKYNLDGVNLGIEITDSAYGYLRNNYSAFVQLLGRALHAKGKKLLVSVGAYFTEAQELGSIYDYSVIGKAADFVHVILYDDYNDTGFTKRGTHGPMSNLLRIGRCLRYASVKMDKSKVLLGMGAYAVDFNLTWWKAQDIDYVTAMNIKAEKGAPFVYVNTKNEAGAYFEYIDDASCKHRVYMETPDTVAQRATVVKNYNLGGFSVFNLTDDNTAMFNAITAASSFKPEVISAMRSGLSPISVRGNYDKPILRHEFCSVIVSFIESKTDMSAEEFLNTMGAQINYNAFDDTESRDVFIANALGIVGGYGNGKFAPDKTISRQEAAVMLMRLAGVMGMQMPNAEAVKFEEESSLQDWARRGINFISACVDKKSGKRVMGGTGNNKFSPLGTYTREQTYMSVYRLFNAVE